MIALVAVLLMAGQATPPGVPAQPSARIASPSPERRAEAYYQFVRGRSLEGEGEVEAAVEAYRRAAELDPSAAEIQAELAALHARQNQAPEAIAAAEAALSIDPENAEAHWVLGTVFGALAQASTEGAAAPGDALDKAVFHLEKARPSRRYDLGLALALGRLYLRKGDYAKAAEQLKVLADQEPGAPEVAFLLAQAYEGGGRRADAIAVLERVVQMEPRYFRAWVSLADLLEKERRYSEAADAYARAVAQNPRNTELRMRQANALLTSGQTAAAGSLLRELVKEAPTDGSVLYLLAETERQLKDYDEAESAARRLMALEPKQVRGAYALSLVYGDRREHLKVIETLTPALTEASQRQGAERALAPMYVRLGFAHQELGQFDASVRAFEQAKAAGDGDPVFDAYLAQALTAAGQPERALEVITAVRKAHPEDFRLARVEADALAKTGDADAAVTLLEREAERRASDLEAQLALAGLCVEVGRFERADAALHAAERRFPEGPLVAFQRGAMFERQQRYDEAEQAFRQALAKDPLHGPTLNYLGYMFAERGVRLDEAVSLLQRALETDPWNGSYLDSLGWAHFQRGDLPLAEKYLALAADRMPHNSVVQDHWGDLLWKQGRRDPAIAAWERALKGDRESIDPDVIARKIDDARRPRP